MQSNYIRNAHNNEDLISTNPNWQRIFRNKKTLILKISLALENGGTGFKWS